MNDNEETLSCSHCGAPMLATHRGPCFVCGKQSENVPDDDVPASDAPTSEAAVPDTQSVASTAVLDASAAATTEHQYDQVRPRRRYLFIILLLLMVCAAFAAGYFWRDFAAPTTAASVPSKTP